MRKLVPLLAAVCLAGTVAPASAQPPTQAPSQQRTQTPAAVQAAATSLPGDNDPTWEKVFEDGFNLPHAVTTDADGHSAYQVGNDIVWRNVGVAPPGSIDRCAPIDTSAGVMTLKPFPNGGGDRWECRITSTRMFSGAPHIFAARVKVHRSKGHLSSFWLNTDPKSGQPINEIDVIENTGAKSLPNGCKGSPTVQTNASAYYGLNHSYYSAYKPQVAGIKHCLPQGVATPLQDDQFHTFHAEWAPGQYIRFYTDGTLSASFGPEYAVDTPLNAILTNIDQQDAANPAKSFEVNWVKVWKQRPPAPQCDNECWRGQLGGQNYTYHPSSNPSDPRLMRIIFDSQFYLDRYPSVLEWAQGKVASQGGNIYEHAEWHWRNYGISGGLMGSATFDPIHYMNTQPDVAAAFGATNYLAAIQHFVTYGRHEGRRSSLVFDTTFYRNRYPDIAAHSVGYAVEHFAVWGASEGRQGSAEFATAWYLGVNPDVRRVFGSNNYRRGIIHWHNHGRAEGRPGAP
ncbi:glycoside hydrolase family 16 protein [Phycicoccus sp. CSK15P-2]|uniref:glycoside hydrolase family 16 protein n=1 Tax=Phycicoccus sp. CSK15P-2 TaxID=2807627 RepID=UPI0019527540|nr:glycoside hydrolase family 16 protein [Phycicoccus sp. CSK15P-2]MBM6403619.1 glycoside hydrolase family 16 protein [Phycicoccus sp. CSK15P-2]MBM6405084.1 glycoside hydrolase family 16 protein [Phycicoccus sp. CSK15P-2]